LGLIDCEHTTEFKLNSTTALKLIYKTHNILTINLSIIM